MLLIILVFNLYQLILHLKYEDNFNIINFLCHKISQTDFF